MSSSVSRASSKLLSLLGTSFGLFCLANTLAFWLALSISASTGLPSSSAFCIACPSLSTLRFTYLAIISACSM